MTRGYCSIPNPFLIVLEYLPYGDLLGHLRKSRGIEDTYNTGEPEEDLLSFAWMISDGMNYLASMKVNYDAEDKKMTLKPFKPIKFICIRALYFSLTQNIKQPDTSLVTTALRHIMI